MTPDAELIRTDRIISIKIFLEEVFSLDPNSNILSGGIILTVEGFEKTILIRTDPGSLKTNHKQTESNFILTGLFDWKLMTFIKNNQWMRVGRYLDDMSGLNKDDKERSDVRFIAIWI